MSEAPDKPEDQPSGQPQPDEEERPQLREVSEDELKQVLEAHRKWLGSYGKDSEQANLSNADLPQADLQGANLTLANLQGASLWSANLQGANLSLANLQGAYLERANLQGANLSGAKFEGDEYSNLGAADLTGADLRNADLADAELSDVKGLLTHKLAGANVSGTKLPEDIREFKVLQVIEETSKNARKVFLAMLLGCAYALLTVATTTDALLLTNSASSPLPIIGTAIPIAYFYGAAPFILMGFYVYLHFYLELLWEGLAGLPARFPDGKRLDERAYPWLLNGLVRRHFKLLKEDRSLITKLKELVTIFLAWWAVPATLLGFWLRYLPRHEWWGTGLHIGLLLVSVALAVIFYRSAARTLRGDEPQPFGWKTFWRDRRTYQGAAIALVAVVFSFLSLAAIQGDPWTRLAFPPLATANLREADVSTKPENWRGKKEDIPLVKGASLRDADLRYADAARAFLVKADLRHANLQKADLQGADLEGADLEGANLQGAKLQGAKLQRANLEGANLQGANLQGAELQEANLKGADLREASLTGTKLQKAKLMKGNLQKANLWLANLKGADLWLANLQGADLRRANLQGADLRRANLQGASLRNANFKGARLERADLQGALYLTQGQLDKACGDIGTLPPDYLKGYKIKPCPKESK